MKPFFIVNNANVSLLETSPINETIVLSRKHQFLYYCVLVSVYRYCLINSVAEPNSRFLGGLEPRFGIGSGSCFLPTKKAAQESFHKRINKFEVLS